MKVRILNRCTVDTVPPQPTYEEWQPAIDYHNEFRETDLVKAIHCPACGETNVWVETSYCGQHVCLSCSCLWQLNPLATDPNDGHDIVKRLRRLLNRKGHCWRAGINAVKQWRCRRLKGACSKNRT